MKQHRKPIHDSVIWYESVICGLRISTPQYFKILYLNDNFVQKGIFLQYPPTVFFFLINYVVN